MMRPQHTATECVVAWTSQALAPLLFVIVWSHVLDATNPRHTDDEARHSLQWMVDDEGRAAWRDAGPDETSASIDHPAYEFTPLPEYGPAQVIIITVDGDHLGSVRAEGAVLEGFGYSLIHNCVVDGDTETCTATLAIESMPGPECTCDDDCGLLVVRCDDCDKERAP